MFTDRPGESTHGADNLPAEIRASAHPRCSTLVIDPSLIASSGDREQSLLIGSLKGESARPKPRIPKPHRWAAVFKRGAADIFLFPSNGATAMHQSFRIKLMSAERTCVKS
jgi:hypothetical protein